MTVSVSRESFNSADEETKLLLIYDMLNQQNEMLRLHAEVQATDCKQRGEGYDTRLKKLEGRRKVDTGVAALGGVLGGAIAVIVKLKIWPNS